MISVSSMPQELVGYYAVADGEVVEGRVFENVATGVAVIANNVTVRHCVMRRLISRGGSGSGVEVRTGAIENRLGPHGGKRVELEVDPEWYYVDPERSFREAYGAYLEKAGSDAVGVGRG